MKDLNTVTQQEQIDFFRSFDTILCDVDGVIWHFPHLITGADSAVNSLRNLKKNIFFISNKTTKTHHDVHHDLNSHIKLDQNELIMPETAIISYLKEINFNKKIYFLGMKALESAFKNSGFEIVATQNETFNSVQKYIETSKQLDDDVGAVITDFDPNINYVKIQRALFYLTKEDTIFITGNSSGKFLNVGTNDSLINSSCFDKILEDFSGRKILRLAKPSLEFNAFITEKHKITNPSKVLFIGDSIEDDMAFATTCGYQKMLVLSGMTTLENVENWKFCEDYKPNYFVDSLKVVYEILNLILNKCV